MRTRPPRLVVLAFTLAVQGAIPSMAHAKPGKGETKQIAEEAFIYGFPMVMNYAVFYEWPKEEALKGSWKPPTVQRAK